MAHFAATFHVALPGALHRQQAGADQFAALALAQGFPDDDVDGAGFVLQRHEGHALGGAGLLAHGDDAAGAHGAAVGQVAQLGGGAQLPARELRAQQGQRVAAQGEAGGGVVVGDGLALAGFDQRQGGLVRGCFAQQLGRAVQGRGVPDLLAAVACEGGQRVGGGQGFEVAGVEGGAQGEVFGGGEGVVLAGGEDAAGGGFGEGGDQAEAQADGGVGGFVTAGCFGGKEIGVRARFGWRAGAISGTVGRIGIRPQFP